MADSREAKTVSRTRRWLGGVVFVVLAAASWTLLLRGCASLCDIKPKPMWTAASGTPPSPIYFHMLGFPAGASVARYDKPDGNIVGKLDRAVLMSIDEEAAGWVGVTGTPPTSVRRSDLNLDPPADYEHWVNRYNRARPPGPDQFLSAKVDIISDAAGRHLITFRENFDHSIIESVYAVEGGRAKPQSLALVGAGGAFEALGQACWVLPLTIITGIAVTMFLAWLIFRDRTSRKYCLDAYTFGPALVTPTQPRSER